MINAAEIWQMEQNFWLADASYFTATMAEGCIMVFPPPTGIITGDAIVKTLSGAPRWERIEMLEKVELAREPGVITIAYEAHAERQGAPYRALCSSTYVGENGNWMLQHHHQTPV